MTVDLPNLARRHGLPESAVRAAADAMSAGDGMAQFSDPELGGPGQWAGGMLMVAMGTSPDLKRRVAALFDELSTLPRSTSTPAGSTVSGGQNDDRYDWNPSTRRLTIRRGGRTTVYDTTGYTIDSAAQSSGRPIRLRGPSGDIDVDQLSVVSTEPS